MGIYIGGTGSANHLDDYEEGNVTWTMDDLTNSPTIWNNYGKYEKYGRLVHLQGHIQIGTTKPTFGTLGNQFRISGMPFNYASTVGYGNAIGGCRWSQLSWVGGSLSSYGHSDDTMLVSHVVATNKIGFTTMGKAVYYTGELLNRAVHNNTAWNLEWDIWYRTS